MTTYAWKKTISDHFEVPIKTVDHMIDQILFVCFMQEVRTPGPLDFPMIVGYAIRRCLAKHDTSYNTMIEEVHNQAYMFTEVVKQRESRVY